MSKDSGHDPGTSSPGSSNRRRTWWVVAGIVVLTLGWFLLKFGSPVGSQQHAATPSAPDPPAESAVTPPAPKPAASSGAPPALPPSNDPVADYRARTRYAPTSGALTEKAVDLLQPNRRYDTFGPATDPSNRARGGEVTFLFTTDKYFYEGDEVVVTTLDVRSGDEPVTVTISHADAAAEGTSGAADESQALTFEFDNETHTSKLELNEAFADHHGPILFTTAFEYAPGKTQDAALRIFATPTHAIPARFTGGYSDGAENGSLVVYAAVEVFEPGFYRLDANLFGSDGRPLAFVNFKGNLDAGMHQVPLEFFGLLMFDLGVPGPYEVRNLRGYLFLDGEYPDRLRLRDAAGSYWTHAYEVSAFSDEEFMTPHKAKMIELLEQDMQSGLGVDHPIPAMGP